MLLLKFNKKVFSLLLSALLVFSSTSVFASGTKATNAGGNIIGVANFDLTSLHKQSSDITLKDGSVATLAIEPRPSSAVGISSTLPVGSSSWDITYNWNGVYYLKYAIDVTYSNGVSKITSAYDETYTFYAYKVISDTLGVNTAKTASTYKVNFENLIGGSLSVTLKAAVSGNRLTTSVIQ